MRSAFRSLLKYIVTLPPIARLSMKVLERYIARQADAIPKTDGHGLPVPDALLMTTVVGHTNWPYFQSSGAKDLQTFADLVDRNGGDFSAAEHILDFGCGCGRLARHMPAQSTANFYGVDYNKRLINWCASNLPGTYLKNNLQPPVDLPSGQFDILYALSIFTHLREATQTAWLAEFARILAPGGFALITFHDPAHKNMAPTGITPDQLARDGIAYYNDRAEGSNLLSTFQTVEHFRALASEHFEICEIVRSADSPIRHAVGVLRRK